jgi:hypothetical protein
MRLAISYRTVFEILFELHPCIRLQEWKRGGNRAAEGHRGDRKRNYAHEASTPGWTGLTAGEKRAIQFAMSTFPDAVSIWMIQKAVASSWLIMATTPFPGAKK